jgi:predicted MFS family arabinose efflux permease
LNVKDTAALARTTPGLILMYASATMMWISYSFITVTLPFRFQSLGFSVVQYGVAAAVLALGLLITESVWGILAFRMGKVRVILCYGVVVAVLYLAVGFSTTYPALLISVGLIGGLFIFQVPLLRWIGLTALGPGTGGRGAGIFSLFSGIGIVVGSALGPVIFVRIGFPALSVIAVLCYVAALSLLLRMPWHALKIPPPTSGFATQVRAIMTSRFLLLSSLAVFLYIGRTLVWNFSQYYSVTLFHGTPSDAGYLLGAAQAVSICAGALLGVVVDRGGPRRSLPFGFALMALGTIGTLLSSFYIEMAGATMLVAIGFGWLNASILPLTISQTAEGLQGTTVGVFGSFEDVGLLVGPILISWIYATYSPQSSFVVVAFLMIVAVGLSLLVRGKEIAK